MKYTHYAPKARVFLADGEPGELAKTAAALTTVAKQGMNPIILASKQTSGFCAGRVYDIIGDRTAPETFCASLFSALRRADEAGRQAIVLEALPADSLWPCVYEPGAARFGILRLLIPKRSTFISGGTALKTVLFVCSGNTCRSPMAEAIFNDALDDRPRLRALGARAISAGTFACEGAEMAKTRRPPWKTWA